MWPHSKKAISATFWHPAYSDIKRPSKPGGFQGLIKKSKDDDHDETLSILMCAAHAVRIKKRKSYCIFVVAVLIFVIITVDTF